MSHHSEHDNDPERDDATLEQSEPSSPPQETPSTDGEAPSADEGAPSEDSPSATTALFLSPDEDEDEILEVIALSPEGEVLSAMPARDEPAMPPVIQSVLEAQRQQLETLREELEQARDEALTASSERDAVQRMLDAATAEREDYKGRLMRASADLENFRKRVNREKDDLRKYGIDRLVLELLPVVDNLDRALEHADKAQDASTIVDGVRMVQRQLIAALERHGVITYGALHERFDPQRHEAIQQIDTPDHETGTVIQEYQKGYFLHERLLRPALVVVARYVAPADGDASSDAVILDEIAPEVEPDSDDATSADVDPSEPG